MPAPRMRAFERRRLTPGEARLATGMFGAELDPGDVRLVQTPAGPFGAMVPHRRTILFSRWRAPRDFAEVSVAEQGWFVHELTHVWQARRGVPLALAKLKAVGAGAYRYSLVAGRPFAAYNIEQQAEIARHVFLARAGAPASDAPAREPLDALWPIRET